MALESFSVGILLFSIECFIAGTLAQEGKATLALKCFNAGALALECLGIWH